MRCPACGVEVIEQAVYCHKCGERVLAPGDEAESDIRLVQGASPGDTPNPTVYVQHDPQNPPENEIWRGGFSSKAMIGAWVTSGIVSLVALLGGIYAARSFTAWLCVLLLTVLPWLYNLSVLSYRRMSVRYLLTTQRFIHESGLLKRINDRIEVLDMDDIAFEQGLLERIVGVGTIRILSTDRSHPEFVLPGIEDVQKVASQFDNARIAERRRRGLHVEQI